mmetsp:Transcript_11283/g.12670  ORF Transcript_11283/g.12670 Transcript_11283/m.12670 type:complete len:134 (-) Transcript_11283:143-544(-)
MTSFTSNYETIKETSSKDKSHDLALISGNMTIPSQGKIQSTFLQSVLSNKFAVAFVVVILGTGLMAYNANPVPPASQFRLGDYAAIVDGGEGGGITASENGGELLDGCGIDFNCFRNFGKNKNKSKNPNKNFN